MSFLGDRLKEIVSAEKRETGKKNARIVAICSQKGGVGKTTTAVNLGSTLAQFHGKKVLVCDLDPQGHVEKSLGSIVPEGVEYTPLSSILAAKQGDLLDSIIKTELEGLSLTPGDKELSQTEKVLTTKIGKEFVLQTALRTAKTHYDYIIFDCPPAMGNLTINALTAAHKVLIPCEMSVLAFEGVGDLLDTLAEVNERLNPELEVLGLVFTRVDGRNVQMNDLIAENMGKYFNGKIFKTRITVNTALNKAQLDGRPIFQFDEHSSGSVNYQSLAGEFLKKL